jgi:hypothetical protein
MEAFQDMAENSFGFGTWESSYWFLGPEQGMSKKENELSKRYAAWRSLGSQELDDCLEFHRQIEEPRWHCDNATPQRTWTRLISALVGYGAEGISDRISYQQKHWGRRPGHAIEAETCVIELSGIAAHNLGVERDRKSYLDSRLAKIDYEMRRQKPAFLVLYGKTAGCRQAWKVLTRDAGDVIQCSLGVQVRKMENSMIAWATHPANFGQTIAQWQVLGQELKNLQQRAA